MSVKFGIGKTGRFSILKGNTSCCKYCTGNNIYVDNDQSCGIANDILETLNYDKSISTLVLNNFNDEFAYGCGNTQYKIALEIWSLMN
jgi:hypothetical protein